MKNLTVNKAVLQFGSLRAKVWNARVNGSSAFSISQDVVRNVIGLLLASKSGNLTASERMRINNYLTGYKTLLVLLRKYTRLAKE